MSKQSPIDEILNINGTNDWGVRVYKMIDVNEAKQALYQLLLDELIGEDERIDIQSEFDKIDVPHLETDRYPGLDGVRQASRNLLKAHQRTRLDQLFNKGGETK